MTKENNHRYRCVSGVPKIKDLLQSTNEMVDVLKDELQSGDASKEDILESISLIKEGIATAHMIIDAFLPNDLVSFSKAH